MFTGKHIAIEGMDGVGKSTVCERLAERTGFEFVEKPLRYLFDKDGDLDRYIAIRDYVNAQDDRVFTSWFYGLGSAYLYCAFNGRNIITSRHLISNFMWSGEEESMPVFDTLAEVLKAPALTVVLYASPEVISARLSKRDPDDPDLKKIGQSEKVYAKARRFFELYDMPHMFIDTGELTPDEICDAIIERLRKDGVLR